MMKKLLFIAVVMLISIFSTPTQAAVNRSGDSIILINNGDTAIVTDSAMKSLVIKAINDTIWSSNLNEDGYFHPVKEVADNCFQ